MRETIKTHAIPSPLAEKVASGGASTLHNASTNRHLMTEEVFPPPNPRQRGRVAWRHSERAQRGRNLEQYAHASTSSVIRQRKRITICQTTLAVGCHLLLKEEKEFVLPLVSANGN